MTKNSNNYHSSKNDPNCTQKWLSPLSALWTTWPCLLGHRETSESSVEEFTRVSVLTGLSGSREAGPMLLAGGCVLFLPPPHSCCEIVVAQLAPGSSLRKARHHCLYPLPGHFTAVCTKHPAEKRVFVFDCCEWSATNICQAASDFRQWLPTEDLPPTVFFSLSSCCSFIVYLVMSSLAF